MSRCAACLAAAALLLLGACGGDEGLPGGPSSERLELRPPGSVEGAPVGYAEYLPPGYGDGTARPLLLFWHGVGEDGDGSEAALRRLFKVGIPLLIRDDEWPEDRPFVVLMPQHDDAQGSSCPAARDVEAFVDFALEQYDLDPARVYLTGISCGAIGVWDYLAAHGDEVVAGAVVIASDATYAFARAGCALARVPIWAFHGEIDDLVPVTRISDPIGDLEACTDPPPEDIRLTIYPDAGHDSWSRTYDLAAGHDIYAWLLEHELG